MHLCERTFTVLADGGVKVTFACGAELVRREESAVDVELLRERFPQAHQHRHHLHLPGKRKP